MSKKAMLLQARPMLPGRVALKRSVAVSHGGSPPYAGGAQDEADSSNATASMADKPQLLPGQLPAHMDTVLRQAVALHHTVPLHGPADAVTAAASNQAALSASLCAFCGKPGCFLCTGCSRVQYCSHACQTDDWVRRHELECQPEPAQPSPHPSLPPQPREQLGLAKGSLLEAMEAPSKLPVEDISDDEEAPAAAEEPEQVKEPAWTLEDISDEEEEVVVNTAGGPTEMDVSKLSAAPFDGPGADGLPAMALFWNATRRMTNTDAAFVRSSLERGQTKVTPPAPKVRTGTAWPWSLSWLH
jgi:hypothetical protein